MPPKREPNTPLWKDILSSVLAASTAVSGAFSLMVAIFLAANYLHEQEVNPLTNAALQDLKDAASRHPNDDGLKKSFREIDEGTRKVFYTSQDFASQGGWLLAGGLLVLIVSANLIGYLNRRRPRPGSVEEDQTRRERRLLRIGVVAGAATLLLLTLLVITKPENRGPPSGSAHAKAKNAPVATVKLPSEAELKQQWPEFRGYGATGTTDVTDFPTAWNGTKGTGVLWKTVPPKKGVSSPVVWHDRIFLTGADKQTRDLYCFDAASGKLQWTVTATGILGSPATLPDVSEDTGYAAPTAATDGRRVFAIFATGDILAANFNGTRIWGRNLGVPNNPYGHASSLIAYKGRVLIQFDNFNGAKLICLDGTTGNTLWEKSRDVSASWSTPLLATFGTRPELILNAAPLVVAYDPLTGAILWSSQCMQGEVGPSPACTGDLAFVTTADAVLAAIQAGGTAKAKDGTVVWETDQELPDVSSPVAKGNLLFVADSEGVLSCYDAKTGKLHWRKEFPDGFYSSPLIAGDRLLLTDMRGVTRIFRAAPQYQQLAECKLGESVVTTPAIVKNRIYIRGAKHLFAIGTK